jgi:formylglycine-generating enzyme required for sulfatase activity
MPTPPSDPHAKHDATPSEMPTTGEPSGAGGGALSLQAGARPLPDYELVRKLGAGGFGEVWHARGPGGMDVALKFIKLGGKGGTLEVRALEMMKSIRHANLVSLFGVWQKDDLLILAMELCDRTLHDRLKEALAQGLPGVPLTELLGYMRDAAAGLDELNAKQVQHRDVKPRNLFLQGSSVKVADFGLAKLLEKTVGDHTGALSVPYAAPEFFRGQVTAQSDQYCLAVTYYELRTGRLPFVGNHHQLMYAHMELPPDQSPLEPEERPAVARALAKEPRQRWPSCKAFVNALKRTEPLAPGTSRGLMWAGLAAALCLAILGVCVVGSLFSGLFSNAKPTTDTSQRTTDSGRGNNTDKDGSPKDGKDTITDGNKGTLPATLSIDLGGGVKMEFVLIDPKSKPDGGVFQMGSPETEEVRNPWEKKFDPEKRHEVRLTKAYYLGKYPVTQEEYVKLTGKDNPSSFRKGGDCEECLYDVPEKDTRRFPVEKVSWNDADSFCREMTNKRGGLLPSELRQKGYQFALPTEAQWEYACRAGTTTAYYFGDDPKRLADHAWYSANAGGRTHRVGTTEANAWGLHDMHGNVWQWCQDYSGPYEGLPEVDPLRSIKHSEDRRVRRGGSWPDYPARCRAACREDNGPDSVSRSRGFRVAVRLD